MEEREILRAYQVVTCNDGDRFRLEQILRLAVESVAFKVTQEVPESRERALALTKLEEASMWITKSITHGM